MRDRTRQLFDLAAAVVLEAVLRSALWLLRAQELPPLPASSFRLPPPARRVAAHRLHAREYQLLVLLRANGLLGYVLGTNPAPDELHCDRRFKN